MPDTASANERRENLQLRAIFPAACEALKPFFAPGGEWGGAGHEHLAYRTLKEQFPQLSAQESFIAVATAKRLYVSGNFPPKY